MTYMLCRNRVQDYDRWKAEFDADAGAAAAAGLRLVKLWRDVEDPHEVFFLLDVADVERAREFIQDPESAKTGERAGVEDGEVWFVEEIGEAGGE